MAELSVLAYRSGCSMLCRVDARFKLLFVVMISLACLSASVRGLLLISTLFVILVMTSSVRLLWLLRSLRWGFFLLALVLAARALSEPGDPVASLYGIAVSCEGIEAGLLAVWRLLIIILAGVFLSITTRAVEVQDAVHRLFAPLPLVPAGRIATMMGLVLRFMPLVLDQARETAAAQRARGIENRKNPLYRIRLAAVPLLRRSFEQADQLALAMAARCFSEDRQPPHLSASRLDWLVLYLVAGVCLSAVLL